LAIRLSKSTSRVFLLSLMVCAVTTEAHAQAQRSVAEDTNKPEERTVRQIVPFLEGTDVFISADGSTRFEADIFPHLIVKQTFADALEYRNILGDPKDPKPTDDRAAGWVLAGTPAVRIRMFDTASAPVRTPSYMPRVSLQRLWISGVKTTICRSPGASEVDFCKGVKPRPAGAPPEIEIWEAHGVVGHHSNGQDGCFLTSEQRQGDGQCRPAASTGDGPPTINLRDGSFSTNYVRIGGNYRRNRIAKETVTPPGESALPDLLTDHEWTLGLDYEFNFHMDPNIVNSYGRNRVGFSAQIAGRPSDQTEHWYDPCEARRELKASVKYIPDRADRDERGESLSKFAVSLQASCFPSTQGGWGIFVRYYQGQDYYNIGFMNDIRRIQIGGTYNQDGFFRFHRAEKRDPTM
jgi:hypothetical protein